MWSFMGTIKSNHQENQEALAAKFKEDVALYNPLC